VPGHQKTILESLLGRRTLADEAISVRAIEPPASLSSAGKSNRSRSGIILPKWTPDVNPAPQEAEEILTEAIRKHPSWLSGKLGNRRSRRHFLDASPALVNTSSELQSGYALRILEGDRACRIRKMVSCRHLSGLVNLGGLAFDGFRINRQGEIAFALRIVG
jgi:hypothetical protein